MINVLMVVPNLEDATSLYRASGPFFALRRSMDVQLVFMDAIAENKLEAVDIVFMQRPWTSSHKALAELCKNARVPLWIDYDDLLSHVPEDNPAYRTYMNKEVQENIKLICEIATVITVTTPQLRECLLQFNKNVLVIPNALPDKFLHLEREHNHKQQVNWRGTDTHQKDLAEYSCELIELATQRKQLTLTFMGWNPWFITSNVPRHQAIVVPGMGIGDYFRFICTTNPAIQVVPLSSHMFNLCKSNIAWLEATLAGAVCVAPAWPEWEYPGVATFRDAVEFKQQIEKYLDNPEMAKAAHSDSWAYIKEHLILSKVNHKRAKILSVLANHAQRSQFAADFDLSRVLDGI